jgi:hypothetical protein
MQDMLEDANAFFRDWGWTWMPWWQLFFFTMFMIFGPFVMCFQLYKTFTFMKNARHEESNKPIEDDDEFEKEEDDIFPDTKESEKEVTVKIESGNDKKND